MKNFIIDLIEFYKDPTDKRIKNYSLSKNSRYVGYALLTDTLLLTIFLPAMIFVQNNYMKDTSLLVYKHNTLKFVLLGIVLAGPLIEEVIFRFPLRYNRFYAFFISAKVWHLLFKILVYTVPLAFGIFHISNYDLNNASKWILLMTPIIVLSQTVGGYLMTFLRVKFNILSTIVYHIIWNLTFGFGFPLLTSYFEKPYKITTKEYAVDIKSNAFTDIKKQKLTIDSADHKIYKIEARELSINHILDSSVNFKREKEDYSIDLNIKSKEGMTKQQFLKIMSAYDKYEE